MSTKEKQDQTWLKSNSSPEYTILKPLYWNAVGFTETQSWPLAWTLTSEHPTHFYIHNAPILSYTPKLNLPHLHDHSKGTPPNLVSSPRSSYGPYPYGRPPNTLITPSTPTQHHHKLAPLHPYTFLSSRSPLTNLFTTSLKYSLKLPICPSSNVFTNATRAFCRADDKASATAGAVNENTIIVAQPSSPLTLAPLIALAVTSGLLTAVVIHSFAPFTSSKCHEVGTDKGSENDIDIGGGVVEDVSM
ncbi:hypothetical protein GYMLUDRAFT_248669 [Collybiopsis luxurians FD-317 M1]|uniref:Uncharacterized protein n=1 Tax=Collybiopsis luxurians FD-317 M1 TaxID=944289 RepID=A0A0D0BZP4_9AGAR|nr:hypothetical protein GYMLUDRAFT_248669 [Collybiopsis luxurians FD-317 M1]